MFRKLAWVFFIVTLGLITYAILANRQQTSRPQDGPLDRWTVYANPRFRVQLRFPAHWESSSPLDRDRYIGYNGFFTLSALNGKGLPIEDAVLDAVGRRTSPYGSNPKIETLSIDGQDARLITPSDDQAADLNGESLLVVKYPMPIQYGSESYRYVVIWADKDHVRSIAQTMTFIAPGQNSLGVIYGTVNVGQVCPDSKPGTVCLPPAGAFTNRKILIYNETKTTVLKELPIDAAGHYRIELDSGTYVVDINRNGLDRSSDVPAVIDLAPGQSSRLDIGIDGGLR